MGLLRTGTASWTDPTLLAARWYPDSASSAEDRLRYYASQFPVVEVDSTYYSMPAERSAQLWVERTPDSFLFDIKAFRLFTHHPTPLASFPKRIRQDLPKSLTDKKSAYVKDLPAEIVDEMWDMFSSALKPLHRAGKLGAVFLQFPKWFYFSHANLEYIAAAQSRLKNYPLAAEFREPSWMTEDHRLETLKFLQDHNISYTCVDEPQGTAASVPPVAAATSDLAVVRFHGRRQDTWDKRNVGVEERFKYLYEESELAEWIPKLDAMTQETRECHALMNNCYADYGVRNASMLAEMAVREGINTLEPEFSERPSSNM